MQSAPAMPGRGAATAQRRRALFLAGRRVAAFFAGRRAAAFFAGRRVAAFLAGRRAAAFLAGRLAAAFLAGGRAVAFLRGFRDMDLVARATVFLAAGFALAVRTGGRARPAPPTSGKSRRSCVAGGRSGSAGAGSRGGIVNVRAGGGGGGGGSFAIGASSIQPLLVHPDMVSSLRCTAARPAARGGACGARRSRTVNITCTSPVVVQGLRRFLPVARFQVHVNSVFDPPWGRPLPGREYRWRTTLPSALPAARGLSRHGNRGRAALHHHSPGAECQGAGADTIARGDRGG